MGKDEEWMRMRSIRLLKTSTHQPEGGGKKQQWTALKSIGNQSKVLEIITKHLEFIKAMEIKEKQWKSMQSSGNQ